MFCPSCKAEYRPGFTECSDCGVALVYELPVDQTVTEETPFARHDPGADLVAVYSTYDPAEVMLIKSLLDGEGIIHNFQGEMTRAVGVFITPAMLFVTKKDTERVTEILREYGIG